MKLGRFVTGWALVRLEGDGPERVLSSAAQSALTLWDARSEGPFCMTVHLRARDEAALHALAARLGFSSRTLRAAGLPCLWARVRRRYALLGAVLLCVLALAASRLFIWRVEIEDTVGLSESLVRQALSECGVDVGSFWPGFSQDLTRNALLSRLPQLRWATVNRSGSTATVILRAAREEPEVEPEDECADIVAVRAGYVTEVEALRGEAVVKAGQTVLPGDTLISGEAVGRNGTHGALRAIGSVQARTWYELSAAAPLTGTQVDDSRCISVYRALIFGKKRINFYKGGSICPDGCAKMIEETELSIGEIFRLPLRLICERVFETQTIAADRETLAVQLEESLTQRLTAALPEGSEILDARFTQSESDGWLYVTLHAECVQPIGTTVAMTEAQIAAKSPHTEDNES